MSVGALERECENARKRAFAAACASIEIRESAKATPDNDLDLVNVRAKSQLAIARLGKALNLLSFHSSDLADTAYRELQKSIYHFQQAKINYFSNIIIQLEEIRANPELDDDGHEIKLDEDAFKQCCQLLGSVAIAELRSRTPTSQSTPGTLAAIPEAAVYPDDDGGIRIEWVRENANVHLLIRPAGKESYIYWDSVEEFDKVPATAQNLVKALQIIEG